ncbi:transcriptional regulator [Nonomuraea sp. B12E4]|uniref:transcriptional regulator n=1 Tax=Nonomuraea sp. B12E4 TaxID=3153564 RepID=UPI00325CF838
MTLDITFKLATFAAVFATLFAAHSFGDHWVQSHRQACGKGAPGPAGRVWCARHVVGLTITKLVALLAVTFVTGLYIHPAWLAAGMGVDAASHYWADRRTTLQALANRLGKADFYKLGEGHLGSGAYALDQSWHVTWLFIASLIMTGGA